MIEKITKVSYADRGLKKLAKEYENNKLTLQFPPVEKNTLDKEVLIDAHKLMKKYLISLGIHDVVSVHEDFMIITLEISRENPNALGCYIPPFIYIPLKAREDPRQYLDTLIHEKYHQSSFHYDALPTCATPSDMWRIKKLGVHVGSIDSQGKSSGDYFRAFNEALTQELTVRTIRHGLAHTNNQEKYGKVIGPSDIDKNIYSSERELLRAIIERVSETKGMTQAQVFELFIQSYFDGSPDNLAYIKDAYGDEALDRLARIPMYTSDQKPWKVSEATGNPDLDFFLVRQTWDPS